MRDLVLAFDLGTGGCKASVWAPDGSCLARTVREYPTTYPGNGMHEQRPEDWWSALVAATQLLAHELDLSEIGGLALSGHSLGVIPIDGSGELLVDAVPIWSDTRGAHRAATAFAHGGETEWYLSTGCGFPAALYPAFKISWFADALPRIDDATRWWLGSKDWIVHRLTGEIATDPSYASGSGLVPLSSTTYDDDLLAAFGIDSGRLPPIVASDSPVGTITSTAAAELRLRPDTVVYAGGVDNSCMAVGSRNTRAGRRYISLGSSSWVTSTGDTAVADADDRPYTFRSLLPGLFDSALSTFSSGTSVRWIRNLLIPDGTDADFTTLAAASPIGSDGLIALPMLAGGAPIEGGADIRGGLIGLDVRHGPSQLARAFVEGAAFAVARAFDHLETTADTEPVLLAGGGSSSPWTCQLYADLLGRPVATSPVARQAAALGAAACAFAGSGIWGSIADADGAHGSLTRYEPDPSAHARYVEAAGRFEVALGAHIASSSRHG